MGTTFDGLVQVTEWLRFGEPIETVSGPVAAEDWIRKEGARIASKGRRVSIRRREEDLYVALFAAAPPGASRGR